jgi:hypothetical protein
MKPFFNGTRHKGILSLVEKFYIPENPNLDYLYSTEPACNGRTFWFPAALSQARLTVIYCSREAWVRMKDCHSQVKIKMISITLCGNFFIAKELLNFTPTGWSAAENVRLVLCNYVDSDLSVRHTRKTRTIENHN